jgi:hypothetical protein
MKKVVDLAREVTATMFPYRDKEDPPPRQHPWTVGSSDAFRYHDFRSHPELIRTSLEDFLPLSRYPAIERYYELLEWVNGPESQLETNDCGLGTPRLDEKPPDLIPRGLNTVIHGRLTVLFRDLRKNTSPQWVTWLHDGILGALKGRTPKYPASVAVGTWSHFFLEIGCPGDVVTLRYWAWGGDTDAAMHNLSGVYEDLGHCFREASKRIG